MEVTRRGLARLAALPAPVFTAVARRLADSWLWEPLTAESDLAAICPRRALPRWHGKRLLGQARPPSA